ncbi:acyl-CoA dehydrogenase family protein [Streptomyces sp. NBC_01092]|uniref:acyl-CoA dehydrogenase family protein n=1 Tax=Streptomyces sp. NBC_01092 TaxID=2903748 RepID=UPI003868AA6C|nr:acyl-CoA dehydrogenase [Streptomyces sp. NBC_01092]
MNTDTVGSASRTLEDALDLWSGDGGPFSPALLAGLDTASAFPADACRALDQVGLADHYVPVRHGGKLDSFPEVVALMRSVARRDLTVAIAHGKTFLGAVSVWVAGAPETAEWLGRQIGEGAAVCWGLTERGHGSDVLAGELTGVRGAEGWRLDGEKWLINNATRSRVACVLARTSPDGGARGFTLFLVDKRQLPADRYRHQDKIRTLGIRGADISGLSLHGAVVPPTAVVGEPGQGGEIVLKALQLTRTACAALSLGAADHALALARRFVLERTLYGRPLADLPLVRDTLARAATRLFLAEAVTAVATRAIHVIPQEMSVVSAVCKAYVPTLVDELITQVGELLGARGYLTEVFEHGAFAKLERDHRIVPIFDGTTAVNRQALIAQFVRLGRSYGKADRAAAQRLADLVSTKLPEFAPERLRLAPPAGCTLTQAVPELLRQVRGLYKDDEGLTSVLDEFQAVCADVHAAAAAHRPQRGMPGTDSFWLAERFEWCFAGAVCLMLLTHLPGDRPQLLLRACLELVVENLVPSQPGRHETFTAVAPYVLDTTDPPTLFGRDQETTLW